jgi:hypothetical protein
VTEVVGNLLGGVETHGGSHAVLSFSPPPALVLVYHLISLFATTNFPNVCGSGKIQLATHAISDHIAL